jgi:formylglycine-generating enzyme required for sulfatase activity
MKSKNNQKYIVLWLFLLTFNFSLFTAPSPAAAAEVKELATRMDGRSLVVEYELRAADREQYDKVVLEYSLDGGRTWQQPAGLTGDVGEKVPLGRNKRIVWSVLHDFPKGLSADIELRVEAAGERKKAATAVSGSVWKEPATGIEMVYVKGGCYRMGCGSWTSDCDSDEKPGHEVCVDDFYIGKYEVTQGQWRALLGNNPSNFKKGDNYPVEMVSWDDAQEFIGKLNGKTGRSFRLPTEAEWEYAARSGGKAEKYAGGNDIEAVAWYTSNSGGATHPVGAKRPNGLGIYDMSGNVWEWCQDWFEGGYYGKSPRNNPQGPSSGSFRVYRGGGWDRAPAGVRAAGRGRNTPGDRFDDLGFRLVFPVGQQ